MRLAIVSDIHGNLPALEAVIADVAERRVDAVWVGGDLVGRGPQGSAVARRIRRLGWPTIGGNHEDYMLDFHYRRVPPEWWHGEEWAASRWMAAELDTDAIAFIEALPFTLVHDGLRLVHGTPASNRDGIGPWTDEAKLAHHVAQVEEGLLVCAHTHRPLVRETGGRRVVNVGSVGLPFNRDPRAQYAIFSRRGDGSGDGPGWDHELRQVEYDREAIFRIYEESGFLAEGGVTARLLRYELEHATPVLVPFLEWARHGGHEPSSALLEEFFDVFDPERPLREFFRRLRPAPAG